MTCHGFTQGSFISPLYISVNVILAWCEVLWNTSGMEVPLQTEMKLAYIAFKSLVVGEGHRGTGEKYA